MAQLNPSHDAEIARFNEMYGEVYAAWVDSLPRSTGTGWIVANDDYSAANDNEFLEDAA
jgi:hypothetical protein